MPFVGLDWRSPGDTWVKTTNGWERAKLMRLRLFENLSENIIERVLARSNSDSALFEHSMLASERSCWTTDNQLSARQPRILMPQTTKENLCRPSLCDAMTHLEMKAALADVRRFEYVVSVIDTMIEDFLPNLSGASQKMLFELVRKMISIVSKTHYNVAIARRVLNSLEKRLDDARYTQIGTQRSWFDRYTELQKMKTELSGLNFGEAESSANADMVESTIKSHRRWTKSLTIEAENSNEIDLDEKSTGYRVEKKRRSASKRSRCDSLGPHKDVPRLNLLDLPIECTMKIVRCLANETDMINLGRIPSRLFRAIVLDERLWRDLSLFRYTEAQVQIAFEKETASANDEVNNCPAKGSRHFSASTRMRSISECGPTSTADDATSHSSALTEVQTASALPDEELEAECAVLSVSTMRKRLTNLLWYRVFRSLQRTCTPRNIYPTGMLVHCMRCNMIYWNCIGHPCAAPASEHDAERAAAPVTPVAPIAISPERFVRMFT